MPQNQTNSLPLPGSDRNLPPDAQLVGPCSPTALITVTMYLRARNQEELQQRLQQLPQSPSFLTADQFAGRNAADPAHFPPLTNFPHTHAFPLHSTYPPQP